MAVFCSKLGRLPRYPQSLYTYLDYIQSSGTQYIDTGYTPNSNTRLVMDMSYSGDYTGFHVFGARSSDKKQAFGMWIYQATQQSNYGDVSQSGVAIATGRVTIDKNRNVQTVGDSVITLSDATFTSPCTLYLFASNDGGTPNANIATYDLYSCQIYDNDVLVRDFRPAMRNYDGTLGLHDVLNDVFYDNIGTGMFTGATSEYDYPSYIEATGTQYINTLFYPNQDTRVVMHCETTTDFAAMHLFGARTSAANKAYSCAIYDDRIQSEYGDTAQTPSYVVSGRLVIDKAGALMGIGGYTVTNTAATFTCAYPLYLFTTNNGGSPHSEMSSLRLYYCHIYDNTTIVRKYVPVRRRSDSAYGLLDLINNVFYANAGTGSFTGGIAA